MLEPLDPRLLPKAPMPEVKLGWLGYMASSMSGGERPRQVTAASHPELFSEFALMAKRAGVGTPPLVIIQSQVANAFATPDHTVFMTTGLLNRLRDYDEVCAVLGHELGHLQHKAKHFGMRWAAEIAIAWVGSEIVGLFYNRMAKRPTALGRTVAVLGSFLGLDLLAKRLTVRPTELEADYEGAYISQRPEALASALNKLGAHRHESPMRTQFGLLTSGYPTIDERIAQLKTVEEAMLKKQGISVALDAVGEVQKVIADNKFSLQNPPTEDKQRRLLARLDAAIELLPAYQADNPKLPFNQVLADLEQRVPMQARKIRQELANDPQAYARTIKYLDAILTNLRDHSRNAKGVAETWDHVRETSYLALKFLDAYQQKNPVDENLSTDPKTSLGVLLGALGHDLGKVMLDNSLLYATERMAPEDFAQLEKQLAEKIPSREDREIAAKFLRFANSGRMAFPKTDDTTPPSPAIKTIADIAALTDQIPANPAWGDNAVATPAQMAAHKAALGFILARYSIQINPNSLEVLTLPGRRGTLTIDQAKVVEAHDDLSVDLLKEAVFPTRLQEYGITPDIGDMGKYDEKDHPARTNAIRHVINETDRAQALLVERSYKPAYPYAVAMQILDRSAENGWIDKSTHEKFKDTGVIKEYANDQLRKRIQDNYISLSETPKTPATPASTVISAAEYRETLQPLAPRLAQV